MIVSRRILISAPKESVRLYLRDLENIRHYESKFERCLVSYPDGQSGFVEASGRFLGLPWKGSFKAEFTADGGCRVQTVKGSLPRLEAGLRVKPVIGGTVLTREERYRFPWLVRPLMHFFKRRFALAIDRELGKVKEGAERLHRQLQLREIDAAL